MVLIALPVAMMSGLGVLERHTVDTPQDNVQRTFGDADLIIGPMAGWSGHCRQDGLAEMSCGSGAVDTVSEADLSRQQTALESLNDPSADPASSHPASTASSSPLLPGHPLYPVRTARLTADWQGLDVPVTAVAADQIRLRTARVELPRGATRMPGPAQIWVGRDAAERYGWTPGKSVSIGGAHYRVTGLVRTEQSTGPSLWVGPGDPLVAHGELTWFGTGAAVTRAQADALNAVGLAVADRHADTILQTSGSVDDNATTTMLILAVGVLAALVTATVAGAAFAIGARQQRRTLALLGATGADRRVMQRLVTRQGLLLGAVGSVLGAGLGLAGANGYLAWADARSPYYPASLGVPVAVTLVAVAIGTTAALVAAWLPARSVARQDVLAGVRHAESAAGRAHLPWPGLAMILVGAVVAVAAAVTFRISYSPGDSQNHTQTLFIPVIAALVMIFVGLVASLSWLVDRAARGRGGPLGVRFALRDLARNRGRGAACVAASMAVMTLLGAVLTVAGAMDTSQTRDYAPELPARTAVLASTDDQGMALSAEKVSAQTDAVEDELGPVPQRVRSRELRTCQRVASGPTAAWCTWTLTVVNHTTARVSPDQGVMTDEHGHRAYTSQTEVVVDDGSLYHLLTGHRATPEVMAAMDHGVVVLDPALASGGRATAQVGMSPDSDSVDRRVTVQAAPVAVRGSQVPALTSSAMAARLLGVTPAKLPLVDGDTWLRLPAEPSPGQADRINATIARQTTAQQAFRFESGPEHRLRAVLRWGTPIGALLLTAVAVVVLALSLSDSRPARQSLAAVGASRRDLKRIAAVQALVTVGIGAVLGVLVQAGPLALAMWADRTTGPSGLPWGYLAVLALGVPVVVAIAVRTLVPAASPVVRGRD